jgi:hypothetical protein
MQNGDLLETVERIVRNYYDTLFWMDQVKRKYGTNGYNTILWQLDAVAELWGLSRRGLSQGPAKPIFLL